MLSELHWKPFAKRVSITLQLLAFDVETDEFSHALGLKPTHVSRGVWCYETKAFVSSADENEHLRYLLRLFLPIKGKIGELAPNAQVIVSIQREGDHVGTGEGCFIHCDCVHGLAQLGAAISFKAFQTHESPKGG
jgi:hypothetical protein